MQISHQPLFQRSMQALLPAAILCTASPAKIHAANLEGFASQVGAGAWALLAIVATIIAVLAVAQLWRRQRMSNESPAHGMGSRTGSGTGNEAGNRLGSAAGGISESLAAATLSATRDGHFWISESGIIEGLNPAAEAMFGYAADDLIGKNFAALVPPPQRRQRRGHYLKSEGQEPLFGYAKDGKRFPIDVTLTNLGEEGQPARLAVSVRNTERRQQASPQQTEALLLLEQIFKQAGAFLLLLDRDGRLLRMNRSCEDFLDFSEGEVRNQPLWTVLAPPTQMEQMESRLTAVLQGKLPARLELPWTTRHGHTHNVVCFFTGVENEMAMVDRVVCSGFDITARAAYEARQVRAERFSAISRMAGGLSHDFNNVLTSITGYSSLLLQTADPEDPNRKDLEEIKRASDRAAALTRQLLAISGRAPRNVKAQPLNSIVDGSSRMLRILAGEATHFEMHLEETAGAVAGDPIHLEEMMLHLVAFCREQMDPGGRLKLATANESLEKPRTDMEPPLPAGDYVTLTISSTGQALPEDLRTHLFEPYALPLQTKGSGLGLAMAYGILRQSGGSIQVISKEGAGCILKLFFPAAAMEADSPETKTTPLQLVPKRLDLEGTETILLVQEQEALRSRFATTLREAGYTVLEARTGLHAMEQAHKYEEAIHLVITDVLVGRQAGQDLIGHIRTSRPEIKYLFASNRPHKEIFAQSLLPSSVVPLDGTLPKQELLQRLREAFMRKGVGLGSN